jgi:deoxyribodipyrimidine photo-lyase
VLWFRRDLRLADHPALAAAIRLGSPIAPLFVLDPSLLHGRFSSPNRIWFLLGSLRALADALQARGSRLTVRVGPAVDMVPAFAREIAAATVLVSRDATPYGRGRDRTVEERLHSAGIRFEAHPGLLVHDPEDILTTAGSPYGVFTPFLRRWQARPLRPVIDAPSELVPPPDFLHRRGAPDDRVPEAADLGVPPPTADVELLLTPGEDDARERLATWLAGGPQGGLRGYGGSRDRLADPAATSRLGADLRFGLLSPLEVVTRSLARSDGPDAQRFVSELAWRDFYAHVLWHAPRVATEPFQARYRGMAWPGGDLSDPADLAEAWRQGRTGLPDRGRLDAATPRLGVHAEPRPDDRRQLPDEGPARGLAGRRGAFHAPPGRWRPGFEPGRLAMGGLGRHRRPAILPGLKPGHPGRAVRSRRSACPSLASGARERPQREDPPALDHDA